MRGLDRECGNEKTEEIEEREMVKEGEAERLFRVETGGRRGTARME